MEPFKPSPGCVRRDIRRLHPDGKTSSIGLLYYNQKRTELQQDIRKTFFPHRRRRQERNAPSSPDMFEHHGVRNARHIFSFVVAGPGEQRAGGHKKHSLPDALLDLL